MTVETMVVMKVMKWPKTLSLVVCVDNGGVYTKLNTAMCDIYLVPGYAGTKGYKRADSLASHAPMIDRRTMDHTDILN